MSNAKRPPFPSVIDSSSMSSFRACPRKFELEYLQHWKPLNESVHLVAGGAYANGLEAARLAWFRDNKPIPECIEIGRQALRSHYGDFPCPPSSAKSLDRMIGALEFYFERYPMETEQAVPAKLASGRLGIEFSFAEPIDVLHPESGEPLVYSGRLDMLCDYAGGLYGEDDKTASSLGATWPKQWDLRSQFTGYAWGCRRAGIDVAGFLIRGVSILKTKYDTMEALTYRPQWQVDRWYAGLVRDLERMKKMWADGFWDWNLDASCTSYGGCVFSQICQVQHPERWLAGSFERRQWCPITRQETKLGELD